MEEEYKMKVFISCDIEGITTTTTWSETHTQSEPAIAAAHARQMTAEVKAACEGAIAAGADYILVKDAHGSGTNIDVTQLPECVEVQRNWTGHPYGMAQGVESQRFDAAMFVGYHNAAGRDGNPLSHTMTLAPLWIKINGVKTSEFMLYSWACALEGTPTVFLAGDDQLCTDSAALHPMLKTVSVKKGDASATRSISPSLACKLIREESEKALRQDLSQALCQLPQKFTVQICYRDHHKATKMSYYPGFKKIEDNIIEFKTKDLFEVLRAMQFVL